MKNSQEDFKKKVTGIIAHDSRYQFAAYEYISNAVSKIAQNAAMESTNSKSRHISGKQLVEGLQKILIKDFDRMAIDVLHHWGLSTTEDIGNVVFNLVDAKLLGVSEQDSIEDFKNQQDFFEMFVQPYYITEKDNPPMPILN